jgi:hypothetical protein
MEAGQVFDVSKVFDMNCQEFWNTMPELARHGDRSGHLRECAACAALWERQRALTAGLRTVAQEWGHLQAPARVEGRLTAAFRGHAGLGARSRPARLWVPVVAWAAAAAALVALAMFLVSERQPQAPRRAAPRATELAVAQPLPDFAGNQFGVSGDSPYNSDEFIPLPNAARIAPNEDVNLVRVEVPRSAMIGLGFEVSAERASEPVQAEVVLGTDGLARAVRFLDE